MKKTKKILTFLMITLFVFSDNVYAQNINSYFNYKGTTIDCTYEVSLQGNQSKGDTEKYKVSITFESQIVDAGDYDSNWAGTGMVIWNKKDSKVIEGPTDSLNIKLNNKNISDYNDLMKPSDVALTPNGDIFLDGYSSHPADNKQTFGQQLNSVDYSQCPDISFTQPKTGSADIVLYPTKYKKWDSNIKLTKMPNVNDDGEQVIKDTTNNTSGYSECYSDIKLMDGDKVTGKVLNTIVRAYKDGTFSISVDGDDFRKVYDNENVVWSGSTSENGYTRIQISQESWKTIRSQVDYKKCQDDPTFQATLSIMKDKDENGNNITEISKDLIDESNGGTGKSYGTGTGLINTANDSDFFPHIQINTNESTCMQILGGNGGKLIAFIQSAWTIVKVVAIVITVLFGVFDFLKAASNDKDVLMESVNKTVKRLVLVLIVLMLPTIIDIIGDVLLGVEDIMCGIK